MTTTRTVDDVDCAALGDLRVVALRAIWRERFGAPPEVRSREILALMLAWRIQAAREGGLDGEARRAVRRKVSPPAPTTLTPGTRLTREWHGVRHEVIVEPGGRFRHQDELYTSLSQVAREITRSRWNGPRFFGLRAREAVE
ncbi:MAG: DUF2924 domain-containing protein [Brevundimonas sp.]